jgi:hypothetical protein
MRSTSSIFATRSSVPQGYPPRTDSTGSGGDVGPDGRPQRLPVDAYYESLRLVVEYRELQHDQPVAFFDKPDPLTISGVHRGAQRRIYDERRDAQIREHGLLLWVITPGEVGGDTRNRLTAATP